MESTDAEYDALTTFIQSINVQYAIVPECITDNLLNCKWITRYHINDWISKYPVMYAKLTAEEKCNLLSFSVNNEDDLKILINSKAFTLSDGTTFKLLRDSAASTMHYITTDEITPELLPTTGRCIDNQFFASNPEFLRRLKKILNRGFSNC